MRKRVFEAEEEEDDDDDRTKDGVKAVVVDAEAVISRNKRDWHAIMMMTMLTRKEELLTQPNKDHSEKKMLCQRES